MSRPALRCSGQIRHAISHRLAPKLRSAMRLYKTNALRGGQLTQNSLPSGSRIAMELPRTVSFAQATSKTTWILVYMIMLLRARSGAAIAPKVQTLRCLPSVVTSSNGRKRYRQWFFNYSQPPLVHMAARFSTAIVACLPRRVCDRIHSG